MWVEFFILGGVWFWLFTALFVIVLFWEVNGEKVVAAGFTIAAYLMAIHLFGDANFFSHIAKNPAILYIGVPAFFLAGTIWALIKWFLYVKRSAARYKDERLAFLKSKRVEGATANTIIPKYLKEEWLEDRRFVNRIRKPVPRENRSRIITWMIFWPFSMVWSVIDEPWRYIYELISNILYRISNSVYKHAGYDEDMKIPEKTKEKKNGKEEDQES